MNAFDLIVVGVIILAAAVGTLRGSVREFLSLVCWALAFLVAWLFTEPLGIQFGRGEDPLLARLAAAVVVFCGTFVLAACAAWLLRRFYFRAPLTAAARILGATLGALRGLAVVLILVVLAGLTALPQQDWWRESWLAAPYEGTARRIIRLLPPEVARQIRYPDEVRRRGQSSGAEPAVRSQA